MDTAVSNMEYLVSNAEERFPFKNVSIIKTSISVEKLFKYIFLKKIHHKIKNNDVKDPVEMNDIQLSPAPKENKNTYYEDHLIICEPSAFKEVPYKILNFLQNINYVNSLDTCWFITSSRDLTSGFGYDQVSMKQNRGGLHLSSSIKFIYAPTVLALRSFFSTLHMNLYGPTLPKYFILLDFCKYREQTTSPRELYDLLNLIFMTINNARIGAVRSPNLALFEALPNRVHINEANNETSIGESSPLNQKIDVNLEIASRFYSRLFNVFSLLTNKDSELNSAPDSQLESSKATNSFSNEREDSFSRLRLHAFKILPAMY